VAKAVNVPVFLSAMTQLPMVGATLGWSHPVGIITANSKRMTSELLTIAAAGSDVRFVVAGLEDKPAFCAPILDEVGSLDSQKIENEIMDVAIELQKKNPEIGAILLECSNMPPYAYAVQHATGLPVFDFTTLINFMVSGNHRKKFDGIF